MWHLQNRILKGVLSLWNRVRRSRMLKSSQIQPNPTIKEKTMADAKVETIINYYALPEGLVSSGQPTPEEFAAIRDAGYQVIINLVPPEATSALANEHEVVQNLGMEYIHIPVIWNEPKVS